MEQWNSREGVGNRDAIRLLGILSSGLLSILIACLFPSSSPLVPARVSGLHATADDHPCASLARTQGLCGIRPCLPRSIQVVSGGERRAFLGLWPDPLSAMRCAPISSCERRNGGGQACGNAVILREQSGRCWRRGRSICQRIGSSGSIKPTTRRNWNRFAGACNEAAPLASRNGRKKSRNVWA